MNKISVLNILQGLIAVFLGYIYFSTGNRVATSITIFILFITSLLVISSGIKRRRKIVEIIEIVIYFIFFGFTFIGVDSFSSLKSASPIPNYFWIVWAVGLIFNWGEFLSKIILKITQNSGGEETGE